MGDFEESKIKVNSVVENNDGTCTIDMETDEETEKRLQELADKLNTDLSGAVIHLLLRYIEAHKGELNDGTEHNSKVEE